MKRFLPTLVLLFFLVLITVVIIAFGRGYRPNLETKTLSSTGLLVATSDPNGAQIFLDGKLKSATNNTLTLAPGFYEVKLVKDGYLPWEKKIKVQGEVVSETQAMLFPSTPSLSPLTKSGIVAPVLSPDGTKIVYAIPKSGSPDEALAKAGLWVLNLTSQPLGFSRDPQLLAKSDGNLDFSAGTFFWSPDSKQIVASLGANYYLLESNQENQPVFLDWQAWQTLNKKWQEQIKEKDDERLSLLPIELAKIATESGKILGFSPDETKLLYEATTSAVLPPNLKPPHVSSNSTSEERQLKKNGVYVYDIKEDKNFPIATPPNGGAALSWFPGSRHLVMTEADKISLLEYDGNNKVTIYNGPFEKFVCSSPSANKILILTSYNRLDGPTSAAVGNLYSINLR